MIKSIAQRVWGTFENAQEIKKMMVFMTIIFLVQVAASLAISASYGIFTLPIDSALLKGVSFIIVCFFVVFCSKKSNSMSLFYIVGLYAGAALFFSLSKYCLDYEYTDVIMRFVGNTFTMLFPLLPIFVWNFFIQQSSPLQAQRSFVYILYAAALGSTATTLLMRKMSLFSENILVLVVLLLIVVLGLLRYAATLGDSHAILDRAEKKEKIFSASRYVDSLFILLICSTFFIKLLAYCFYNFATINFAGNGDLQTYLARYATWVGIVSFGLILGGVHLLMRLLSTRFLLLLAPLAMICSQLLLFFGLQMPTVLLVSMVTTVALFSFLYKPTLFGLYTIVPNKNTSSAFVMSAFLDLIIPYEKISSHIHFVMASHYYLFLIGIAVPLYILWIACIQYAARVYDKAVTEEKCIEK